MSSSAVVPNLSDEALTELLDTIGASDSVELKLTVPVSDRTRYAEALGVDPLDGQIRQVYFFDTPDLALNARGIVVRGRRVQGRGDDSVVKLRPVVPDELPADVRRSPQFGVEVDAMPGGTYVCSGSMKRRMDPIVRAAVNGETPLRKIFSKEQRALYASHAPEGLELDDLSILGPILVLKVKFAAKGSSQKFVAELSTKCTPPEAFQVMVETRTFLTKRGIDLSGDQETKTKKALQFYSKRLQAARA